VNPALTRFDRWLRHRFTAVNTELEEIYFAARAPLVRGDPTLPVCTAPWSRTATP
jgi:hypothetical protein